MRYLIKCGYAWANGQGKRRIGIISLPCESAGAGLVALGAIRYRLTLPEANDALSHFERIERLAARRDGETCLRHQSMRGRFRLEPSDRKGLVWVRQEQKGTADKFQSNGPARVGIHAANANEWRLDREAPAEALRDHVGDLTAGLGEGDSELAAGMLAFADQTRGAAPTVMVFGLPNEDFYAIAGVGGVTHASARRAP